MALGSTTTSLAIVISAIDDASGTLQKVGVQLGTLDKSSTSLAKSFQNTGKSISEAGQAILPVSIAAAGALGVAAKSAVDFQQKMELLHTQAGMSQADVDRLNTKLLDMAGAVGAGPSKLADAFYAIASAHQGLLTTAQMLDMLRVSAEGAAVGQADLTQTADALSGAVASGIKGAEGYAQMMGVLNAIVGAGKMHMQDLIGAMGTGFLSAAATAGVSLQSVGTALATMTDNGVPAEQAATRIRMAIALMASPSQVAAKALAAIGLQGPEVKAATDAMTQALADAHITTTKLADDMRQPNGLLVAMQDLKDHLDASGVSADAANAIIARSFGGGRTDAAILTMLQNMDRMREKFQLINSASGKFADDWAAQQQTASQHVQEFTASIDALGVRLGNIVLPVLTRVADAFNGIASWLGNLDPRWQTFIVATLALGAAAAPLLMILGGIVSAIGALMTPVGLVALGVVALGVALAAAMAYWKNWQPLLNQITGIVGNILGPALNDLWQSISKNLYPALVRMGPVWKALLVGGLALTALSFGALIGAIYLVIEAFTLLANIVSFTITMVANWIGQLQQAYANTVRFFGDVAQAARMFFDLLTGGDPTVRAHSNNLTGLAKTLSAVRDAVIDAATWFGTLPGAISTAVTQVIAFMARLPGEAWNNITDYFLRQLPYELGFALGLVTTLGPRIFNALVTEAKALPGQLTAIWQQVYSDATTWLTQTATQMGTIVSTAFNNTVAWFSRLPGEVTLWLTSTLAAIWAVLSGLPGVFLTWLTASYTTVVGQLTAIRNATTNEVSTWPGRVGGALSAIPGIVGGIFNQMKNVALGEVNSLWNGLVALWDKIKSIFGQIADAFNKGLSAGSSIGKALHLPGYATGTSFAPGGMALVGENGPELVNLPRGSQVIPNGQSRQMLQSSSGPLVSIGTVINQTATDMESFARDLGFQISLRT